MTRALSIVVVALIAFVASLPAQQITRRDSAGVEIVTVPGAMLDRLPTWKLSAQPTLVIGDPKGLDPYVFDQLMTAVRLADGQIVVADGMPGSSPTMVGGVVQPDDETGEIRFFGPDGRFRRLVGGLGAATKVSSQVRFLDATDRGLLSWDARNERILVLDTLGAVVESRKWNTATCDPNPLRGTCAPIGALSSGAIVTTRMDPPLAPPLGGRPAPQPPLPFVVTARTTFGLYRDQSLTEIDSLPGPTRITFQAVNSISGSNMRSTSSRAFDPSPLIGVGRTQMAYGDGGRFEVRFRDETRLTRILRVTRAAKPVGPAELEAFRQGNSMNSALLQNDTPGDSMPHFGSLVLDDANRLWAADYGPAGDGPRPTFTIFNPTGVPVARLTLPAGFLPLQYGADFVLGSEDTGVQVIAPTTGRPVRVRRVVMYRIETSGE